MSIMDSLTKPKLAPKDVFPEPYLEALEQQFAGCSDVLNDVKYVETDQGIVPYVLVGFENEEIPMDERPILYISGFGEGMLSQAPLSLALAEERTEELPVGNGSTTKKTYSAHRIIMNELPREDLDVNPDSLQEDSAYTQAQALISLLEVIGVDKVNVVAHSFGSIVLEQAIHIAKAKSLHYFDDAKIALIAPAGCNDNEAWWDLTKRYTRHFLTANKDNPDAKLLGSEIRKQGIKKLAQAPVRTVKEVKEVKNKRLNFGTLTGVGSVAVLSYRKDLIFPDEVANPGIKRAFESGAIISGLFSVLPSATEKNVEPRIIATHNEEQVHPREVAVAVKDLMEQL